MPTYTGLANSGVFCRLTEPQILLIKLTNQTSTAPILTMFQSHFSHCNNDTSRKDGLQVGPVYGGILDSPLVFPQPFVHVPITPPRSTSMPPLLLPLDTSSHFLKPEQPQTGLLSPVSPTWPVTPPNSADDGAMCISDPEEMLVLDLQPNVYGDFDMYSANSQFKGSCPSSPMDVESDLDQSEMLVDFDDPYDFTSSPFYSPPPELDEDDGFSPTSPLSPSFDDIADLAPCSPTLRLNTCLPHFQANESKLFSSNLFSLPGADVDEDLIPGGLCLPKSNLAELSETSTSSFGGPSLLMVNSTANIPIPPTPSPDQLDIDISRLDEVSDLRRLAILRKKSQEMEKGLKVVEEQMLQQGEVQARADIRRERKWYKERSREITAMLKLIVGEDIFSRPAGSSLPAVSMGKKTIASMDRLVARMVYKRRERNDLPRPIASACRGLSEKKYQPSKLSQCCSMD